MAFGPHGFAGWNDSLQKPSLNGTRPSDQYSSDVRPMEDHCSESSDLPDAALHRLQPQLRAPEGQSRCRCGRGEPGPGADVAGVSPVPVQMGQG